MAQSLTQIYVHVIFHIKNHDTLISSKDSEELYTYMCGVIKNKNCTPIIINGMPDHIHILCILSKNMVLSKLVQEIKQNSSRWLRTKSKYYRCFEWQAGYGAFSVSPSLLEKTEMYIKNQQSHHAKRTFKEEYLLFLREYGVEYNEQYLWQ